MVWNSKTKPTPANIRKRISAAQEAIDGAMDLVKAHPTFDKKQLTPLVNAYDWLVDAQRRTMPKGR
jgi:hypothetical protein